MSFDNVNEEDNLDKPFDAYEGDESYIFVSYAHKDANIVFPEIERFHEKGYPIWYDQGLTPGQEWDDEIAEALLECSLLVVFISKNSMESTNVQDEIKLALEEKIDVVPIYLEKTKLPPGLRLRLSNKHAIFKYSINDNSYIKDCFKAFNKANIPLLEVNKSKKEGFKEPVKIEAKNRKNTGSEKLFQESDESTDNKLNSLTVKEDINYSDNNDLINELSEEIHNRFKMIEEEKGNHNVVSYNELSSGYKNSLCRKSKSIIKELDTINCEIVSDLDERESIKEFSEKEIVDMAIIEHDEWCKERHEKGWIYGEKQDYEKLISPYLVPWDQLTPEIQQYDIDAVNNIPTIVESIGRKIVRKDSNYDEPPIIAYQGDEPYIFVSYSHEDAHLVFPEIKRFQDMGYNVWYDEGITSGKRWQEVVETALVKSKLVVVFISRNAVELENVRNEIFLAIDERLDIIPIFLEETTLQHGLAFQLSAIQSIFKYQMTDEYYVKKLEKMFERYELKSS